MIRILAAATIAALALSACAPVTDFQGYQAVEDNPNTAKVGEDTKISVRQRFGSPSSVSTFDPNIWFYIGQTSDQFGAYLPKVRARDITAITFDKTSERVASIEKFTAEDGRIVAFNERETPTVGRELSIMEQLLGTVGTGLLRQTDDDLDPGNRGPQGR